MKFFLIPDKFKGSLTSEEVANAIQKGIRNAIPESSFKFIKASDGGDGFLEAITSHKACSTIQIPSQDPLGRPIVSNYLFHKGATSAYVELANASGMELLLPKERNPMLTSTYGSGLQIKDAIKRGATKVYIGLGGSATNDGGMGIAAALGYSFLDTHGAILKPIGENLLRIAAIDDVRVMNHQVSFYAVNDVLNPLHGPEGAAFIYARQKGASEDAVVALNGGLMNLDIVVRDTYGKNFSKVAGTGAAGGTAYGLKSFFDAQFVNGIDFILELSGVDTLLTKEKFDYIITGEGRIDEQTANGKLVKGVAALGKKYHIPVLAVCGKLDISGNTLRQLGIQHIIEIQDKSKSLEYNMQYAFENIQRAIRLYFNKTV